MFLGIGMQNGAVFQRNAGNVCEHRIAGTARFAGDLLLKASCGGKVLANFDNIIIGRSRQGKISGTISGLPVGGPYTLDFYIAGPREHLSFKDILVGDVWILAGQSNMAGYAFLPARCGTSDMVHAFYMDNTWGVAKTPIHDTGRAVAPIHGGNPANPPKSMRGACPGLPFAVEMYKRTNIPQAVIPCAHGGTSLDQWDPALKKLKGNSFYGAAVERIEMLGGKVAGLLWYQGCSDTNNDEKVAAYSAKTRKIFNAFRKDCKNPDLPVVLVQLAGFVTHKDYTDHAGYRWLTVRCKQYKLARSMKNCACVPAIDLELDDHIHLSNNAVNILGKRMAEAMLNLQGAPDTMPPIQLKSAKVAMCKVTSCAVFTVEFDHVAGQLVSGGLPCGFAVINCNNEIICEATNIRLQGNKAVCQTRIPFLTALANNYSICYGGALQPHCNIVDEANRSLPCFASPVKYVSGRVSQLLLHALVSEAVYGNDDLAVFHLPSAAEMADLKFSPAKPGGFFVAVPREAGELNKKQKIYYYKFAVTVETGGDYKMMFGSDANFAVFCDGKEVMRQHTANPVVLDEFKEKLHLTAGRHDFCCVFSSNCGNGWGICCRFTSTGKNKPPVFLTTSELM